MLNVLFKSNYFIRWNAFVLPLLSSKPVTTTRWACRGLTLPLLETQTLSFLLQSHISPISFLWEVNPPIRRQNGKEYDSGLTRRRKRGWSSSAIPWQQHQAVKWVRETRIVLFLSTFPYKLLFFPTFHKKLSILQRFIPTKRLFSRHPHSPAWDTQPHGSVEAGAGQTGLWRKETNYTLPHMPTRKRQHKHKHTRVHFIKHYQLSSGWTGSLLTYFSTVTQRQTLSTLNINSAREANGKPADLKECMLRTRTGPRQPRHFPPFLQ